MKTKQPAHQPAQRKSVPITVITTPDVKNQLAELAKLDNRSMTREFETIITKEYKRRTRSKKPD